VRFPVSDAEQHYRCIVSALQEYTEARQGSVPGEQRKVSVSPICSQLIKQKGEDKGMPKYVIERDIPAIGNAKADEIRTIFAEIVQRSQ